MIEGVQLWLFSAEQIEEQAGPKVDLSGVPHIEEPKNDNEWLLEYQYRYKVLGDDKALGCFYNLGYEICKKMINQETHAKKQFKRMSVVIREEKASDAVMYVITSLLKKPSWYIHDSVTAYLYLRVQHELKYKRKVDSLVDFVDLDAFFKECDENEYGTDNWDNV